MVSPGIARVQHTLIQSQSEGSFITLNVEFLMGANQVLRKSNAGRLAPTRGRLASVELIIGLSPFLPGRLSCKEPSNACKAPRVSGWAAMRDTRDPTKDEGHGVSPSLPAPTGPLAVLGNSLVLREQCQDLGNPPPQSRSGVGLERNQIMGSGSTPCRMLPGRAYQA